MTSAPNRAAWVMGALAIVGTLAAVGIFLNAYKNSGTTPKEFMRELKSGSRSNDPLAPKVFDPNQTIRVHVAGAVRKPGVYSLPAWSRVIDAVKKAGGATPQADLDAINLADKLQDTEQVRIPYQGRNQPSAEHPPTPEPGRDPRSSGGHSQGRYPFVEGGTVAPVEPLSSRGGSVSGGVVNLNTAGAEELDSLPGVGPKTAEAIMQFRQEHGAFQRPEDLLNVKGIGPAKFEKLRDKITAP
jgi:competence protein ComEA